MMVLKVTPELEARIDALMTSGEYSDEADVLSAAVELLEKYQRKEAALRAELQIAEEQLERGETVPYDENFMDRLMNQARERSRLGLPVKRAVQP